jgi:hypothetical protein
LTQIGESGTTRQVDFKVQMGAGVEQLKAGLIKAGNHPNIVRIMNPASARYSSTGTAGTSGMARCRTQGKKLY